MPTNQGRLCATKKAALTLVSGGRGQVVAFVFGRRTHVTFRRLLIVGKRRLSRRRILPMLGTRTGDCLIAAQHYIGKVLMQRLERK